MKNIVIATLVAALIIMVFVTVDQQKTIRFLDRNNSHVYDSDTEIQRLASLASTLSRNDPWYIMDTHTVSSKPDGQGKIVKLDKELLAKGSHRSVIGPRHNGKVSFSAGHYTGGDHTMACGLVVYSYID